jgi:hypothetical protein
MRFGLFTSMGNQTWPGVLELWQHTEATQWDVACVTDHFMPNTKEREGNMLGTPQQIRDTLAALRAARVDTLFIPTLFRPLPELRRDLDRFIAEIAPAFR